MKFLPAVFASLMGTVLAQNQTFYWHRDQALGSAGGIARSYNWAANQDGSGQRPASLADDQFGTASLDTAWKFLDQDGSDSTGTNVVKDGKFILSGRGADFTQGQHFLTGIHRKDIKGVFDVTVRVDSQVASHDWSKAGIMMSNDWTDFSQGGTALVAVTPKQGVIFESSPTTMGNISVTYWPNPIPGLPVWLRLVKTGANVTAWYRTDSTAAWTQAGNAEVPLGMAANSDVGLFVVMVDSAGKTAKTTAAAFDDFRGGSDIASAALDLRFDGTGPGHDVDVTLAGDFSAHSLDFAAFPGNLIFGANNLTLSGGARFSPAMSVTAGTGTLIFTGASGTDNLFLKPGETLPAIRKTGAGKLVIQNAALSVPSLTLASGVLDFGGNSADLGGFTATGGSLEGLDADDSLAVTGAADFSGLTALNIPLGRVVIKTTGSGTTLFNPGGKTFPRLTLSTLPATAQSTLVVGPGALSAGNGLVLRNRLNGSGFDGVVDFRTHNPAVTVDGDILQIKDGTGTSRQTLLLGNGAWSATGNVGLSLEAGGSADNAVFTFAKASGIQTLSVTNGSLFAVEHEAAGTLKLTSTLAAARLRQAGGSFDFGGFDLTLKGDLTVVNGAPQTFLNLGGRTVTVGGAAAFAGKVSGDAGVGLGLAPATAWKLKVTGTLTADSTDVGRCDASGFTKGIASKESHDLGQNLNWRFWAPPMAPTVTRDPVDVVAKPGWKVSFSAAATGSPDPSFSWYRQGDTAALSHDTSLVLDSVLIGQDGSAYFCVVANSLGKDTTRQALLSVRACDSSFAAPAGVNTVEGALVKLSGKAGCASEVFWNPVSGPVPRLLDPQVDTLIFPAPRVQGDSILVLQFSARYGANWESGRVTVKVKDSIPDPAATLDALPVWNGKSAKVIRPKIANASELAGFTGYPLRYLWAVDPLIMDTAMGGDSLVLGNPQDNGSVEVSVCVDNGGSPSCAKAILEIQRITTAILMERPHAGPVWLSGSRLSWTRPGLVRIVDWQGRILWQRWGVSGAGEELPAGALRSLRTHAARMDFLAEKSKQARER